jgi:hypothetical protein
MPYVTDATGVSEGGRGGRGRDRDRDRD